MIENIQFRKVSSTFLLKLDKTSRTLNLQKLYLSADKTKNFYKIKKEDHEKILYENMTKIYKKEKPSLPKNSI